MNEVLFEVFSFVGMVFSIGPRILALTVLSSERIPVTSAPKASLLKHPGRRVQLRRGGSGVR